MSNSVDERVVVLRFDNAQFEQATKSTMSTLERLKESLKFKSSTKELNNVSKAANSIDLSGMSKAVDTVNNRFSALGMVGASVIHNLTTAGMGFAKNIIMAIPNQIKHGGLTRALNIEQAKFQINGLKKSWDDLYKDMDYAVDGTAYGIDQAARAAAQLSASQVEAGEEMKKSLRGISGVAAMTGADYDSIAQIFTKVAGAGRVTGETLMQISYRGMNAAATLKDFFNGVNDGSIKASDTVTKSIKEVTSGVKVTEEDIRKLVKGNHVSFRIFAEAMDNAFGPHAKAANDTYAGSLANLKAALSRIGEDRQKVRIENLMNVFNAMRPIVNELRNIIAPLQVRFNKLAIGLTNKVIPVLHNLEKRLKPLSDAGAKVRSAWDKEFVGIQGTFKKAREAWSKTEASWDKGSEKVKKSSKKASKATKELGKVMTVTKEEAQAAWDIWLKGTYGNQPVREKNLKKVGLSYKNVQAYVNDLIRANFDLDKTTIKVVDSHKKNAKAVKEVNKEVQNNVTKTGPKFVEILKQVSKTYQPIKSIGIAIKNFVVGGLIGVFRLIKKLKDVLAPVVTNIADKLLPVIGTMAVKLKAVSQRWRVWIKNLNVKSLKILANKIFNKRFLDVFKNISKMFHPLKNIGIAIKNLFTGLGNLIKRAIGSLKNIKGAFGPIKTGLSNFAVLVASKILPIVGRLAKRLRELSTRFVVWTKNFTMSDKTRSRLNKLTTALKTFGTVIGKIGKAIFEFGKTIANHIVNFIKFEKTSGNLQNTGQRLVEIFKKLGAKIKDFFKNIKDFFVEASKSEGFKHLIESIKELAKHLAKLAGSSIAKAIENVDKLFDKSFEKPKISSAVDAFSKFADTVANFVDSINKGENPLKKFFENFKKNGKGGGLKGNLKNIGENLVGFFKSLKGVSKDSKGLSGNSGPLNAIKGFFGKVPDGLARGVETFNSIDWYGLLDHVDTLSLIAVKLAGAYALVKNGKSIQKVSGSIAWFFQSWSREQKPKKMDKFATVFKKLAVSIALMAGALFLISKIKSEDLKRSMATLLALIGTMVAAQLVLSKFAKQTSSLKTFISIGLGLLFITMAMKKIAKMDPDDVKYAGTVMVLLFGSLMIAANIANGIDLRGFLGVAAGLLLLIIPLKIFAKMPWDEFVQGGSKLVILMGSIALASRIAGKVSGKSGALRIMAFAVAVGIMAPAIMVLAKLPAKKSALAAAEIAGVMLSIAYAIKIAKMSEKQQTYLVKMAVVIGVVGTALVALAKMPIENTMVAASALAGTILIISQSLALMVDMLKAKIKTIKTATMAIVVVIAALTGAFIVMDKMGVKTALKNAIAMSLVIISLTTSMAILAHLKVGAAAAAQACLVLDIAIGNLAGVMIGLGALMKIPHVKEFMQGGADAFGIMGEGIGKFFGGIIDAVGGGVGGALSSIGQGLSDFADAVKNFVSSISGIDETKLTGINTLLDVIGTLTTDDIKEKVRSFFTGDTKMDKFGDVIAGLGTGFAEFAKATQEMTPATVEKAATMANALSTLSTIDFATMAASMTKENIEPISEALPSLAGSFYSFSNILRMLPEDMDKKLEVLTSGLSTLSGADIAGIAVKYSDEAMATLVNIPTFAGVFVNFANVLRDLPINAKKKLKIFAQGMDALKETPHTTPGLFGWITGFTEYTTLSDQLTTFASAFSKFAVIISVMMPEDAGEKFSMLGTAMNALDKAPTTIPGILDAIIGFSDLDQLSEQLVKFGTAMGTFSTSMEDVTAAGIRKAEIVCDLLKTLDDNAPETGFSFKRLINGDTDYETLGADLEAFGDSMKTFFNSLSEIGTPDVGGIIGAMQRLSDAAKDFDASGFTDIGSAIGSRLTSGIDTAKETLSMDLSNIFDGITIDPDAGMKVGNAIADALRSGINSQSTETRKAAETFVTKVTGRIKEMTDTIREAGRHIGNNIKGAASSVSMSSTGKSFVEGFASGINLHKYISNEAAKSMAKDAKKSAKNELDSNSPSKEMIPVGQSVPEGFALGIKRYTKMSTAASKNMANKTLETVKAAAATIDSAMQLDDEPNPVVTPVLDLTNVRAGASSMYSMFANKPNVGMSASINASMNARALAQQQSANTISELSKRLDKVTNAMNSRQMVNYITVDGAENPEAFANRFVRELSLRARAL